MKLSGSLMPVIGLGAALALLAGCGTEADTDAPKDSAQEASTSATSEASSPTAEDPGTSDSEHAEPAARAAQAALAAVPGAVISLDPERGDVWSVLVRTEKGKGTELYIDSATGEVHRQRSEPLPAAARASAPSVEAVDAIDIVLDSLDGGRIEELDLDTERGKVVWEVLASDSRGLVEFYVDANSGSIVKQERDD